MAVTVKELIDALSDFDEDDIVILAKDREGNDFSPLDQLTCDNYTPESTWSGSIHLRALTPEDEKQGYTEEDVRTSEDNAIPCVTLWPVN